jgi:hypothetical protein
MKVRPIGLVGHEGLCWRVHTFEYRVYLSERCECSCSLCSTARRIRAIEDRPRAHYTSCEPGAETFSFLFLKFLSCIYIPVMSEKLGNGVVWPILTGEIDF